MKHPYRPFLARTTVLRCPVLPSAHDCVMLLVVREGSASLSSEFEQPIRLGDAVLLGGEHAVRLRAREIDHHHDDLPRHGLPGRPDLLAAHAPAVRSSPCPAVRQDDLCRPGSDCQAGRKPRRIINAVVGRTRYFERWQSGRRALLRMQALLFSVLDVLAPFVKATPIRLSASPHARAEGGPKGDQNHANHTFRDVLCMI